MKKVLALVLCLVFFTVSLTSCSNKYQFTNAFFEIELVEDQIGSNNIIGDDVSQKYVSQIDVLLESLTAFINERFELKVSKPSPKVKSFSPSKESIAATYNDGTLFLNTEILSEDTTFVVVHELIHYLSDNDGNIGFCHDIEYQGSNQFLGYGLTEGMTDLVATMYCNKNSIPTPDGLNYGYINNDHIAESYYMLNPKCVEWLFTSNYENMSSFVKSEVEKVATIPSDFSNEFDFHFYIYQDILMDYSVGNIFDSYAGYKCFSGSFEILCVAIRACDNIEIKSTIYSELISLHDTNNMLKGIIMG